ncbi:hypothetical protein [Moraxella oblonga]|uniref:hypothetical protein n=1 Tax=Moraxella oblonga TaxID=200413 RepID=UPI00082DE80A|nr:hypothetical protein [Moraxella oblonga]
MKINNFLSIIALTSVLLGCHNNALPSNHQSNHISTKQTLSIDEQLSLLTQHTWQFEKGENLIDENLKLLDGTITLNFAKSEKRGEMHDPDYDLNYQYHFSVDAGCNHNSSIVGFDKTTNKVIKIKTMSFSTLVGCYPDHETTIQHFIKNDNISYQVDENQLLFRDDNNQTLFFKKKP